MSLPGPSERRRLEFIADFVRERFSAEAFTIEQGLSANETFRDGELVRSSMIRKITHRAIADGAIQAGLGSESVTGGGWEVQSLDGNVLKHYRVRRITEYTDEGEPILLSNGDALLHFEGDSFYREERHVFAVEINELNQVASAFVALVEAVDEIASMGRLVLGPITMLESKPTSPGGFRPADEDLEGYDEDGINEDDTGT